MKRPAGNQLTLLAEAAIFCKACGRRLRTPESRRRGYGLTCYKLRGADTAVPGSMHAVPRAMDAVGPIPADPLAGSVDDDPPHTAN